MGHIKMSDFITVNNLGPRAAQYKHFKIASLKETAI